MEPQSHHAMLPLGWMRLFLIISNYGTAFDVFIALFRAAGARATKNFAE
jgi:hypothetical protein